MKVVIKHRCSDYNSYRAARVKSLFNAETGCNFNHEAEIPTEEPGWKIGLIVGPSGSGKSSLGEAAWGGGHIHDLYAGWPEDKPIVDCIAPDGDFNQVTGALAAVGLGDVPAWLRPFKVLSNGEKFRAGLARLMVERPQKAVIDEFTSVVDRHIAQIGASAFAKSWRRGEGQVILLSPHYDIVDWLEPDWVYNTLEAKLARDCLRRPEINLELHKVTGSAWKYFKKHYYLDLPHPVAAEYFVGVVGGEIVSHVAVAPLFTAKAYRATRLVVMPEWQGVGVGTAFLEAVCQYHLEGNGRCGHKFHTFFHTSHPQLCNYLRRSKKWDQTSAVLYGSNKKRGRESIQRTGNGTVTGAGYGGHFRAVQGFKYLGK